jgi:hypothetical protein
MKIDQVAFYCPTFEGEQRIKQGLGLLDKEWVRDEVTARSRVLGGNGTWIEVEPQVAELQFNYDLGIEVEILRYLNGMSWHDFSANAEYIAARMSHVGMHVDEFPETIFPLVQETWTKKHTNEFLTNPNSRGYGRLYHYRVHHMGIGAYLKFIKRIDP